MKLYSPALLGMVSMLSVLAMDVRLNCADLAASGLLSAAIDLAFEQPGAQGEPGQTGQRGPAGADGADGEDGVDGATGANGAQGPAGPAGEDGQGQQGAPGAPGAAGADGQNGSDGTNGLDGQDGIDGASGLNCWDANANGIFDASEDLDLDGAATAADCRGADGQDLTGVIARGTIPADGTFAADAGEGITMVERIDSDADGFDDPGRYMLHIGLDAALGTVAVEDLAVLIALTGNVGEPPALVLPTWFYVGQVGTDLMIEVQIRSVAFNLGVDNAFSVIVLTP